MKYSLPVNPIDIANAHGIEVIPKKDLENVSGSVCNHNGHIVIEYNANENPLRQRFTIAHEIGHYLAGHVDENNKCLRDSSKSYSKKNYDFQEVEANRLAAEILMPKKILEQYVFDKHTTSITELAEIFDVSELAMQYRLKNIGLIS